MLPTFEDRTAFASRLNEMVSVSQPIQSIEHLHGRTHELDQIDKALFAPGRHVFIYGDRGVGKSSLAATAAAQYQSADARYIDIGCGPDATLNSVVANIALQAMSSSRLTDRTEELKAGITWRFLNVERTVEDVARDLHAEVRTVLDAVEVLREVAALHSSKPIVVMDEFDRIGSIKERHLFADLVKHLGDKKVPLKFIFTGVGSSLDDLLGAHPSAIRQFATIHLERLSWDGRWEIVLAAAAAFKVTVPRDIYIRIAAVSDGFPYYVHLVTEHVLWAAWEDPDVVTQITWDHYRSGLKNAITSIDAELHRPYKLAVTQRTDDYEEVLWSTADGEFLQRFVEDMYGSYSYIMKQREDRTPLPMSKYRARIRALREPRKGSILVDEKGRNGLYRYRETMLRGYVRMQAEVEGVELAGDKDATVARQTIHVPASARRGYRGSQVPRGVRFSKAAREIGYQPASSLAEALEPKDSDGSVDAGSVSTDKS